MNDCNYFVPDGTASPVCNNKFSILEGDNHVSAEKNCSHKLEELLKITKEVSITMTQSRFDNFSIFFFFACDFCKI